MNIKRDILGTIVDIELTEQELTEAYIAHLEHEIAALKGSVEENTTPAKVGPLKRKPKKQTPKTELVPTNVEYLDKLHECCDRLRGERSSITRGRIIDEYRDYMMDAQAHGLTARQISVAMGVCDKAIRERLNGLIRMRSMKRTA